MWTAFLHTASWTKQDKTKWDGGNNKAMSSIWSALIWKLNKYKSLKQREVNNTLPDGTKQHLYMRLSNKGYLNNDAQHVWDENKSSFMFRNSILHVNFEILSSNDLRITLDICLWSPASFQITIWSI